MIINSRSSNFWFTFPKGFWNQCTIDKYTPYIKRNFLPYDTLDNFMAAQIQSVTFPTLSMDPVQQTRRLGKKQEYKNSTPISDLFTRSLDVTFKSLDGYINYWIMLDNIMEFLKFNNDQLYFEDLQMRFLDQEGRVVTRAQYKGIYFTNLSEINASYSDNNPEFKTFTVSFGFYSMEIHIDTD